MIVFVVGVYKSGTSVITSIIENIGVPSVVEDFRSASNVTGVKHVYNIRESYEVNLLNNDIIYSTGQTEMYYNRNEMPHSINDSLRNRIRDFYKKINYNGVIKDPRFTGTLQYWIDELPTNVQYKIVWVDRTNISDIVKSFQKDPWFVSKVNASIGYTDTVIKLNSNLYEQMRRYEDKGICIDYDFYIKYPDNVSMLLYNFLTSSVNKFDIKKIHFAEYYGASSVVTQLMSRQCPYNVSVWNNFTAVSTQEESDYVIIQDKSTDIIVDESKVIFFGREPKHVPGAFRSGKDTYFKNLHHERGEIWMPQTWWLDIDFNTVSTLNPTKTKNLSVIDSGKRIMEGHSLRLQIIKNLEIRYPNKIDIYGKINGKILPTRDKKDGMLDYRYYLSIENGVTDHYFSEKLSDAILCLAMPIYIGCAKLEEYLPPTSFIRLDTQKSIDEIVDDIIKISESDYREKNIDSLLQARDLILNKYNIWPTIEKVVNES